jgi:hypothetical protein
MDRGAIKAASMVENGTRFASALSMGIPETEFFGKNSVSLSFFQIVKKEDKIREQSRIIEYKT